jgi:hypothetical protein
MMQYGGLRSSYAPTGKEYVTRWNPLAAALAGDPTADPTQTSTPKPGQFGSGMASGALSGGRDDTDADISATVSDSTKGQTSGAIGSPSPVGAVGGGLPGMGYGKGGTGAMLGGALGLVTGAPLGIAGNMIGTAMDVGEANKSLGQLGQESIGFKGWGSGVLNNLTFGLLGDNIGLQWGNRLNAASPYGMVDPQAGRADPGVDPFSNPMADPYGGMDPNNMGPAPAPFAGGDPYGGGDPNGGYGGGYGAGMNDGSGSDAPGGFAKGGHVTRDRLIGPNPPGPDDGYAALDVGEVVVKASDVKRLGGPDKTRKRLAELLAGR